uniref:Ig-like domain-containing protein n=1 Tax=Hucho hucho TaxID=62062 RepID=A0A4W5M066_9TELE
LPQGLVNGAEGGTVMFITNPPAQPARYGDRITLNKTTGSLELRNLTLADGGEYKVAITTATAETINGSTELVVYENVSNANITGPPNHLFADWSSEAAGNITAIQWMKEDQPLSAGGNILFSEEHRKVSISPVKRHDSGENVCKLTNPASSATASYNVIVNLYLKVSEVCKVCPVQSVLPAAFIWLFIGQQTDVHEAGYIIRSVSYNNSGEYRCDARNDLTGKVVSMGYSLSVKGTGSSRYCSRCDVGSGCCGSCSHLNLRPGQDKAKQCDTNNNKELHME